MAQYLGKDLWRQPKTLLMPSSRLDSMKACDQEVEMLGCLA